MGLLARTSTVISRGRMMAMGASIEPSDDPFAGMYRGYYPPEFAAGFSAAGIRVTPERALTLSAMWSGLTRIAGDFMRMPVHISRLRDDGGKERVRGGPMSAGIEGLAYRLRWKPNQVQTAAAFFALLAAQYVMRGRVYAEILPGPDGAIVQLLPRHPDRVEDQRLASGRLRFKIYEPNGEVRYVTQEEMLYAHDTTSGGMTAWNQQMPSRFAFAGQSIGINLAAEYAAARFFRSGMNAAIVASHPGPLNSEEKEDLHRDISRYAAGAQNNFGILLVEEDIRVSALGIDPQKAQMMEARNFGVREAARWLHMPPEMLYADNTGAQTGRSREEIQIDYHTGALGPIAVVLEQAMQDALILRKDRFIVEFLMDALYRGDLKSRAEYYSAALEGPWMWPSEIRMKEGMNADSALDAIAEKRYRPADPKGASSDSSSSRGRRREEERDARALTGRDTHRFHLLLNDCALRVVRREKEAVTKLARKYATDVEKWRAALREFYADHARFVADTMRLDIVTARAYCAAHGTALETEGLPVITETWERDEAEELVALALNEEPAATAA